MLSDTENDELDDGYAGVSIGIRSPSSRPDGSHTSNPIFLSYTSHSLMGFGHAHTEYRLKNRWSKPAGH